MLKKILENNLTSYYDSFDNWEDAIRKSYAKLLEKNYIKEAYIDNVIGDIKKYGPYIVIAPYIAIPHSAIGDSSVIKNGFAFTKVSNKVLFPDVEEGDKEATIFFSFCAINEEEHLKRIVSLSELLSNDDIVNELYHVKNDEDLWKIINKYNINE